MATSQNGWPVLEPSSTKIYDWVIPASNGTLHLRMRNGSAGFLLAHFILWYSEVIQDVTQGRLDDWGYAYREVIGASGWSNHASGTAADLDAIQHPLSKVRTGIYASRAKVKALNDRLAWMHNTIRWGGNYNGRKDEMHFEINVNITQAEKEAKRLMKTWRGQRILKANPTQKKVILS